MAKFIIRQILIFCTVFFLFAILANGICFLLIDSLFAFFEYPSFPPTLTNPLYILFPLVFVFFSVPNVILLSLQSQFSVKKRFLLLLESHSFFFFWQVLFWTVFCYFTMHYAHILLQVLLGSKGIDASLTSIYMPLVLTKLMPVFAILFVWISVRTSLFLLKDEEKNVSNESMEFAFSFTAKETERAFNLIDYGNTFLLLCVAVMFLPLDFMGLDVEKYVPKLCSDPLIILVCYFQYSLAHWYRTEKRKCLLLLGILVQIVLLCVNLSAENTFYQFVFLTYFASQMYAHVLFYRYGKGYFTEP